MKKPITLKCCKAWRTGVPPTWLVVAAAVVAQVGFGLYPVIVKKYAQKHNVSPLIFSFYRDALCFPVLIVCALVAERKLMIPHLRILIIFMLLGLIGMFGGQVLYILGVYFAGPDIASAFQPIIPVWTAILAVLTCIEKVPHPVYVHGWAKFAGITLAAGGAIEITVTGQSSSDEGSVSDHSGDGSGSGHSSGGPEVGTYLLGCISLILNTVCTAVYVLLQKRFIFMAPNCRWKDYPVGTTAYSYFFGALFMGLASLYYPISGDVSVYSIPQQSIYAVVYAVLISSALCYLLITWTNMHLSSSIATAFWPVQVFVAVLSAWFITGDTLQLWQFLGAVMLLVGLMLVLFSNHMSERQSQGRPVWRLDAPCKKKRRKRKRELSTDESPTDEYKPLLSSHGGHQDYTSPLSPGHYHVN